MSMAWRGGGRGIKGQARIQAACATGPSKQPPAALGARRPAAQPRAGPSRLQRPPAGKRLYALLGRKTGYGNLAVFTEGRRTPLPLGSARTLHDGLQLFCERVQVPRSCSQAIRPTTPGVALRSQPSGPTRSACACHAGTLQWEAAMGVTLCSPTCSPSLT